MSESSEGLVSSRMHLEGGRESEEFLGRYRSQVHVRCVIDNRVAVILTVSVPERTKIPGEGTGNPTLFLGVFESTQIIC